MRLTGPKEVGAVFAVDGGLLKLDNGVATFHAGGATEGSRDIPDHLIPDNVWGFGFHQEEVVEEKPVKRKAQQEE